VQAAWAVALAAVVAAAVRRGVRDDRRDGERTFGRVLPLAVAATTGAAMLTVPTLLFAAVVGAALVAAQASAQLPAPEQPAAPVEELT
jgi:hypothetical protein